MQRLSDTILQRLADRAEIQDCLCRYVRGVDRGDWEAVRSTYHPDANDHHVEYRGGVDGLIAWLEKRFDGIDNSTHFLGNCLIEFAADDFAFVETYYVAHRLRPPSEAERAHLQSGDMICRASWGRYVDHFERRAGQWRVSDRLVVNEASYNSVALGGARSLSIANTWGRRDSSDPVYRSRQELFAKARASGAHQFRGGSDFPFSS